MEAGINLKALGTPIQLVVRIRPLIPGEERLGDLRITDNQRKIVLFEPNKLQGTVEDEYTFDYVYADSSFQDLFERTIAPMLVQEEELGAPGFLDGVNCAILVFGNSGSGKTYTSDGNAQGQMNGGKDGVIPSLIEGIFDALNEKQGRVGGKRKMQRWRYQLSVQYIEVVDEKITDLLNPVKIELDIDEQGLADGLGIKNLTRKLAYTSEELAHYFKAGQSARTTARTEFGTLSERAASVFSIELHQVQTQNSSRSADKDISEHLYSRFVVIDLPGAEKMAEDPTTLRIREGPTLNNGVICLASVLKSLAQAKDMSDLDYVDFDGSKLTRLLSDVLGGSCRTTCITTIPPANYQANSFTLQYASLFSKIHCFPVINDGRAVGLLRRLSSQCYLLKQQIAMSNFGGLRVDERGTRHLMQVAELEKKIIDSDKVRLALLEEREQLREKLIQLNARVNQLLGEKAQVQEQRIESEEERLKVSKVLVDLQIEHTSFVEQAVDKEFQLENKLLQQENDMMELQVALQARNTRIGQLESDLKRGAELVQDLRNEVGAAKANYSSVLSDLDSEKARCEELSIELLNLVNSKNALLRERAQAREDLEALQRHNAELQHQCEAAQEEQGRAAEESRGMRKEVEAARLELERARLEVESGRVQFREQQVVLEKRYAEQEKAAGEEMLLMKRERLERHEEFRREREELDAKIHALSAQGKQARRRAAELETEVKERGEAEEAVREELSECKRKLTQVTDDYRDKLRHYMAALADHSAPALVDSAGGGGGGGGGGYRGVEESRDGVERMLQELVETHGTQERRLLHDLDRARAQLGALMGKNRRLYQAYRSVRYQLEDLAPADMKLEILDEAALHADSEEPAGRDREVDLLRGQVAGLEKKVAEEAEAGLKAAEARTREAREVQAALAGKDRVIGGLEARVKELTVHRGEMERLEEQLLAELVALKNQPHLPAPPRQPAPPPAGNAGQEEEHARVVQDLRRQLDRAAADKDRLAQELDRARTQPPPGPAAAELQSQITQLQQTNRQLEEKLRSGGGGAGKEQEMQALEGKVSGLESEAGRLRAQVSQLQQEKASLEDKVKAGAGAGGGGGGGREAALEAEVSRLKNKVAELEAELAKDDYKAMIANFAQTTQQELEAEVSDLRTKVLMLEQENSDLQDALRKKR